jgi:glycosyltransferase involved in cell wall biosynthesis
VPPDKAVVTLYQAAAETLERQGRDEQAVELLQEGIKKVPPDKAVVALYQAAAGALRRRGKVDEVLALLREGLVSIPERRFGRYRLAESYLYVCLAARRGDRIDDLIASQGRAAIGPAQKALAESLKRQLAGDWVAAAEAAHAGRKKAPTYLQLAIQEAFAWLCAREAEKARHALKEFPREIRSEVASPAAWLKTWIAIERSDTESARRHHATYLDRTVEDTAPPDRTALLALWNSRVPLFTPHPAYYHPTLPPNLTGLPEPVTRPPSLEPLPSEVLQASRPKATPSRPAPFDKAALLAVATEWASRHGGLSTLNRELCCALARVGHPVACLVPEAGPDELREAEAAGVRIIEAPAPPGTEALAGLLRPPRLPEGFEPDIILGHGRITGGAAKTLAEDHLRSAVRIHMIHMAPGAIEPYKQPQGAAARAEERERLELDLAADAAMVVAVGPRLFREAGNLLAARPQAPPLHRLDPGLPPTEERAVPPGLQILVLGRSEDDQLKGLDIAALALAKLPHPDPRPFEADPVLVVRGAPPGKGDELHVHLAKLADVPRDRIRVREYTAEATHIQEDLRRACLLLIPSRTEGFGLVGLEALALGTPTLISARSGLGELLVEKLGETHARNFVVEVKDDTEADATEWARAIEQVLRDPKAAFARTAELQQRLEKELSWTTAAQSLMSALTTTYPQTKSGQL